MQVTACVRAATTQGQLKDADRIFVVVATATISSRFQPRVNQSRLQSSRQAGAAGRLSQYLIHTGRKRRSSSVAGATR